MMDAVNTKPVSVIAVYHVNGNVEPESVIIDDIGYKARALRITPMSTTKKGGTGTRYEVLISGKRNTLYFEDTNSYADNRKWHITDCLLEK